ncbi:MAG: NUDIX hydrolase [Anaerovoracaceae bacterium]|nr:NUDIX hydrolase [Anaerovoracaceae bacterium]
MRYRFCSSCTEEMERGRIGEGSVSSGEVGAAMQGYNCVMIYSTDEEKILFCRRLSDPYKGKFNLVGGKIEEGEDHFDAAYRELFEETGIRRGDVELFHMMDFTYYNQNCYVEIYTGVLKGDVELVSEKHPLCWLDAGEDFFDLERFAGEGNIGHMVRQVKDYGRGKRGK